MVLDPIVPGNDKAIQVSLLLDVESVTDDGHRAHGLNQDPFSARQKKSSLSNHVGIEINLNEPRPFAPLYVGLRASVQPYPERFYVHFRVELHD